MSKYSDYLKERKNNRYERFFGEGNFKQTNKRVKFKKVLNDDV